MRWKELLFGGSQTNIMGLNIGLLILRVYGGLALAFNHGINKIPPSDGFIKAVGGLGFPVPEFFSWCSGFAEFGGGILLALGLFSRPASFFILINMSVAGFIRHAGDPFSRKEMAFLYAGIAVLYLLAGAGKYAADNFINRRLSK